ncbi:hypothetical protein MJ581_25685 [Escherichia coli]|nr:hypothetical protein MJ581_25685 [Escherichia coli]
MRIEQYPDGLFQAFQASIERSGVFKWCSGLFSGRVEITVFAGMLHFVQHDADRLLLRTLSRGYWATLPCGFQERPGQRRGIKVTRGSSFVRGGVSSSSRWHGTCCRYKPFCREVSAVLLKDIIIGLVGRFCYLALAGY